MLKPETLVRAGFATLGSFIAIALLLYLTQATHYLLIMASFGATCVLLFALPEAPLAQPRNVIGGHFITAFIGLLAAHFLPNSPLVIALAVGVGIGLMIITRTPHPPAGGNPLIIMLGSTTPPSWWFLLFPVLSGSLLLVVVASLYHPFTTKAYAHSLMPEFLRNRK